MLLSSTFHLGSILGKGNRFLEIQNNPGNPLSFPVVSFCRGGKQFVLFLPQVLPDFHIFHISSNEHLGRLGGILARMIYKMIITYFLLVIVYYNIII